MSHLKDKDTKSKELSSQSYLCPWLSLDIFFLLYSPSCLFCKLVEMSLEALSDALSTTVGCTLDESAIKNDLLLKNSPHPIGSSF